VDWSKHNVDEVFEAKDGEEALEIVKSQKPDLIITDIKMPNLDGLEFIEEIRKSNDDAKVIFISGYSEFEYAQRALKLDAVDYVTKPIDESILEAIIEKCFSEIENNRKKDLFMTRSRDLIRECLPLAQSFYLNRLLHGEVDENGTVENKLKTLEIKLSCENILVISFFIDFTMGNSGTGSKSDELALFAVKNIVQEFYSMIGENYIVEISGQQIAVIVSADMHAAGDRVRNTTHSILKVVKRFFKYEVTAGIGTPCVIRTAADAYRHSLQALENRFLNGGGVVYDANSTQSNPKTALNDILTINFEMLVNYVKLSQEDKIREMIQTLFDTIIAHRHQLRPAEVKSFLSGLVTKLDEMLQAENRTVSEVLSGSNGPAGFISNANTLQEAQKYIMDFMTTYLNIFNQNLNRKKKIVDEAIKFISEHYHKDISMTSAARALFLNPSYFSKLFSEQAGITFSEYLTRVRMEYAKALLKESYLKVYEIAQKVGYTDYRHFTKKFKETQGISPVEYRD
jgi:two-component system response regulator YesN